MKADGKDRKLSRRAFLRASFSGISVSLLAACGASSGGLPAASSTSATVATSAPVGAAATAAQPTAAPLPLPVGAAGKLTVIHRTEFFAGAQTKFHDLVTQF